MFMYNFLFMKKAAIPKAHKYNVSSFSNYNKKIFSAKNMIKGFPICCKSCPSYTHTVRQYKSNELKEREQKMK